MQVIAVSQRAIRGQRQCEALQACTQLHLTGKVMTSYYCFNVTLVPDRTVIELQATEFCIAVIPKK